MAGLEKEPRPQRYRRRLPVAFGPTTSPVHSGFTTNLSATGFGVTSNNVHPRGTKLFLTLTMPTGELVKSQGEVAWARRGQSVLNTRGSMGVRISSADEGYFRYLLAAAKAPIP
jgi:hypothetical protein